MYIVCMFMGIVVWAQEAICIHIYLIVIILDCLGQVSCRYCIRVELPVQRRLCPIFLKWRRVTRHPLVFRMLTGSQRTPGFGASQFLLNNFGCVYFSPKFRENFEHKKIEKYQKIEVKCIYVFPREGHYL